MNRAGFVLFSSVTLGTSAFLSAATGCGGGTGGTGGSGTGGTASHSSSSTATVGNTGGAAAGTGGAGTGGATVTLDCTTYCTEIMANCTGAQAQFSALDTCMGTCAEYPPGTLADTSGDTLGCRVYHAGALAKADAVTHCPHAGPTGGDRSPTGTAGVCGEPCDAFCDVAMVVCAGQPNEYATKAACMTECAGFAPDTTAYSTADTSGDTMGCRVYHLTAASASATAAATHCAHIHATSPVCM